MRPADALRRGLAAGRNRARVRDRGLPVQRAALARAEGVGHVGDIGLPGGRLSDEHHALDVGAGPAAGSVLRRVVAADPRGD